MDLKKTDHYLSKTHKMESYGGEIRKNKLSTFLSKALFRSKYSPLVKGFLPALLMIIFYSALIFIIRLSFTTTISDGSTIFTLQNYKDLLFSSYYMGKLISSLGVTLLVTVWSLILSYPLALILVRSKIRFKSFIIFILTTPLFVSIVVRTFGWIVILGDNGLINATLRFIGLGKIKFMGTTLGVVLTLVNIFIIYSIVPIISSLSSIKNNLTEAALLLGASRFKAWYYITWPLSTPGVASGFVLVFSLALSSYLQPKLIGGYGFPMISMDVYRHAMALLNWELASALGIILLLTSFTITSFVTAIVKYIYPQPKLGGR